jgi:hypothetical protein
MVLWLKRKFGVNFENAIENALVKRFLIPALVSEGASSEEILRHISNAKAAISLQIDELNRIESRLTGQPINVEIRQNPNTTI